MASNPQAFEIIAMKDANGFLLPKYSCKVDDMDEIVNMKTREGDVFVVTYPKCGTTWSQYTIWSVVHKGARPPTLMDMMLKDFPFVEMTGAAVPDSMPSPRTMKLHTPYRFTPISDNAKNVIVVRNPFDCCVSWYHHIKGWAILFKSEDLDFDVYFDSLFMTGDIPFGDYFDFLQSWYEHKDEPNVLFLFYEEMKADPKTEILKLAEFLGEEYAEAASDNTVLENIVHHSSFKYMKKHCHFFLPTTREVFSNPYFQGPPQMKEVDFIRKGEVDDWKNYMSEDQKLRLLAKIEERMGDTDIKPKLIPKSVLE